MADQPKKSAGAAKRKPRTPAKSTPEASEPEVETTDAETTPEVETAPEPAAAVTPRRTAEGWLSVCGPLLNVKPRILRAAVSGQGPGRKYTEDEIRRLIQRKLGEPA